MPAQGGLAILSAWKNLAAVLSNGVYSATSDSVASDEYWRIDSIVLVANPYVPCLCFLYHDLATPQNFITRSLDAGQDVFEGQLEIPGGSALTFVWAGEVGSSVLTARFHYTRYRTVNVPTDPALANWRGPR